MNNTIVVGMGEALWDMLPEGKKIGGAPANFAYHVSQFGLDSRVVSAVGEDELGVEILKNFHEKKLNCMIETVPYPTGTVQVELDALLRHPRGRGVGQHPLHSGTGRAGAPDPRRMFRLAGTAQRGVARDYQPLLGRNARRRGAVQEARDSTRYSTSTCARASIPRKSSAGRCASATS